MNRQALAAYVYNEKARRTHIKGGGYSTLVNAYFDRVTNGFRYGFADLSKLYLTTAGLVNVAAGGDSIGLALDRLRGDGRGVVNQLLNSRFLGAVSGSPGTIPPLWTGDINNATMTALGDDVLTIAATAQRTVMRQSYSLAAAETLTWSTHVNIASGTLEFRQVFDFSIVAGPTYTYFIDGVSAASTDAIPAGEHDLRVTVVNDGTPRTLGARLGIGVISNQTGAISFSEPQLEVGAGATTYQANSLVRGGPGYHANQSTGGSRGSYQAGDILRVVTDDGYATGLLPGKFIMARAKLTGGAGTRAVAGASGSATARFNLYFNSSGAAACRVGDGAEITAGGDLTDVDGTIGIRRRADDTIDLVVNGEVAASAAMSGSPTTAHALALAAINNNGALSSFFAGDFITGGNGDAVLAGDAAPTDSEQRALHRHLMAA